MSKLPDQLDQAIEEMYIGVLDTNAVIKLLRQASSRIVALEAEREWYNTDRTSASIMTQEISVAEAPDPWQNEAEAFLDFVLRHTWPERAKEHGLRVLYNMILFHPFAIAIRKRHNKLKPSEPL